MARLASFASLAVLVALAGCYNPRYPGDAPGTDRSEPAPVRSGSGAPVVSGAGGSAPQRSGTGMLESIADAAGPGDRLTVRMDHGGTHTVVQDSANLSVGDRVEITSEGRVIRR